MGNMISLFVVEVCAKVNFSINSTHFSFLSFHELYPWPDNAMLKPNSSPLHSSRHYPNKNEHRGPDHHYYYYYTIAGTMGKTYTNNESIFPAYGCRPRHLRAHRTHTHIRLFTFMWHFFQNGNTRKHNDDVVGFHAHNRILVGTPLLIAFVPCITFHVPFHSLPDAFVLQRVDYLVAAHRLRSPLKSKTERRVMLEHLETHIHTYRGLFVFQKIMCMAKAAAATSPALTMNGMTSEKGTKRGRNETILVVRC